MKKIIFAAALLLIILSACNGNIFTGNDNPDSGQDTDTDNPIESVVDGVPSWLADKTWKGKSSNSMITTPDVSSEALAEAFEIKTSKNDVFIPSITGSVINGELANVSVEYGLGFIEQLESANMDYTVQSSNSRYSVIADHIEMEINTNGSNYTIETSMSLIIEKVSDIQIRFSMIYGNTITSGDNTEPEITPGYTVTALMTRV